jgi:hypothetical protein
MAYFKMNKVIMEVTAVMRSDRHPELNAGWIQYHKDLLYTRRQQVTGPHGEHQDAAHSWTGDGRILDKEQVAGLVDYARQFHVEVIPEIQSLTHSYYLLTRHRELAEIQDAEWPDTYCPLHPGSYELYFNVLDEYIEVIKPETVHIGHDEWRMAVNVCERCKGKDYTELFIQDVLNIHDHLSAKNIRVAMWGDHFLESFRGKGLQDRYIEKTGYAYQKPGAITPRQVEEHIPKDILVLNWSWRTWGNRKGEEATQNFQEWGFEQVLGNFNAEIVDFSRRSQGKGILGGQVSAWCRTTESDIGPNRTLRFVSTANHLWSAHYPDQESYSRIVQDLLPVIRESLRGTKPPSRDGNPFQAVDISASFNTLASGNPHHIPFELLQPGTVKTGGTSFGIADPKENNGFCATMVETRNESASPAATRSKVIPVDQDASSLVFLHACAHRAGCEDLLGWYRIVYEDGFEESVPIRYSVNIREWHLWGTDPLTGQPDPCLAEGDPYCTGRAVFCGNICYEADVVDCSSSKDKELNFFAFEWTNPRFGIKIKEICLEGMKETPAADLDPDGRRNNFRRLYLGAQARKGSDGLLIDDNAIALVGLSIVTKRDPESSRAKKASLTAPGK